VLLTCCAALEEEESKLTDLNSKLETGIAENESKTKAAEEGAASALQQYTEQSSASATLGQQLSAMEEEQSAAEQEEQSLTTQRIELIEENENLTEEHKKYAKERPGLLKKMEKSETELAALRKKYGAAAKKQMEELCAQEKEVAALQDKYDTLDATVGAKRDKAQATRDLIAQQEARIVAMEAAAVENETLRRKLHNTMCELKGNIRVFCRVRPIKDSETIEGERDTVGTPRAMENDKEMVKCVIQTHTPTPPLVSLGFIRSERGLRSGWRRRAAARPWTASLRTACSTASASTRSSASSPPRRQSLKRSPPWSKAPSMGTRSASLPTVRRAAARPTRCRGARRRTRRASSRDRSCTSSRRRSGWRRRAGRTR